MINANEISFGVELETHLPQADDTYIGGYHHGAPVAWLNGWKAERDGSIECPASRKPCEFISPILKGFDGILNLVESVSKIAARDAKVNESCGVHVTVEFKGDAAALARLINLVGNHETAIFASTGTKRRERGHYCKGIKNFGGTNAARRALVQDETFARYHVLNLTHVARGHNRVEFRAFAGSVNPLKIAAYVMMCIGLVELAITQKRSSSWNYKPTVAGRIPSYLKTGNVNQGVGETEVVRLFKRLNWTAGWYKGELNEKSYGEINGVSATRFNLKNCKKELIRLARKYDAADVTPAQITEAPEA